MSGPNPDPQDGATGTRDTRQTIDIHGTLISPSTVVIRAFYAVVCAGLSILFWHRVEWRSQDDITGMFLALAATTAIAALVLPGQKHTYLDLILREVVSRKTYAGIRISERHSPLAAFSHIVVRHLCHSNGEGPDTYTGSVGLRPVDGGATLWVKDFPATEDRVPSTTHDFARELQRRTGLPTTTTMDSGVSATSPS